MNRPNRLLVLGLGNVLVGDDGLGAIVVHQLTRQFDVPQGVSILDGGTLGLALLPLLQDCDAAIFVDAVRSGDEPPGTLIRIDGAGVLPAVRQHLSVHQIGVADLLDAARLTGGYPSELVLLGIVPENLELGVGLSPSVLLSVPSLIRATVEEIARFGFVLRDKKQNRDTARRSGLLDLRG
jgi:hydrogenase maturation protease